MALRSMAGLSEPHTFELASQRLATVIAEDTDTRTGNGAVEALYDSVNAVRRSHPFQLEPLRMRRALEGGKFREAKDAMWGLPIPAEVHDVPSTDPAHPVRVEVWEYGLMAEILHEGSRAEKNRADERLRKFIEEERLEVVGPREEEYLTAPGAPVPRTFIRYRVRRR